MKKNLLCLLLFFVCSNPFLQGQGNTSDSILMKLKTAPRDADRVELLLEAVKGYYFSKPDTSLLLSLEAVSLADELNFQKGQLIALNNAGESYRFLGDYPHSLEMQLKALQLNREMKNWEEEAGTNGFIGFTYLEMGEYRKALEYLLPAKPVLDKYKNTVSGSFVSSHIASCYTFLNMTDSAMWYNQEAIRLLQFEAYPPLRTLVYDRMGAMYLAMGKYPEASEWYHQSLYYSNVSRIQVNISREQKFLSDLHFRQGHPDSALYFGRLAYSNSQGNLQKPHSLDASLLLSRIFHQKGETDSAYYYQGIAMILKDSIYGPDQFRKLQLLMLEEQKRQQELIQDQIEFRNSIKYIALFFLLGFLAFLAIIQRRNNIHKQKINSELEHKKENLEKTIAALKSAQTQLIQAEKMASLGELTAGIAHEIQNPLNFVNNFAEINNDLIADLKDAAEQNDEREIIRIVDQLKENQDKIKLHGKRADSIVKSMLQHSRAGSGSKELTDINKMVEEYVRLSFHGMRARDKNFNTEFDIRLDPALGKIPLLPQDFGRVLLNLLNNAFYSVNEKKKISGETYKPVVVISTQLSGPWNGHANSLRVVIADNGKGIKAANAEKIFQPFFTTKPTGEGTGLGLSLSYDIITNGHGGELSMNSEDGEGAEFLIILPLQL